MFKHTLALLLLLFSFNTFAIQKSQSCSLDVNEVITIGCTWKCSKWNRWGLRKAERRAGYKVNIVNLYSENATPNLSSVDGILIPGGADINPKYYTPKVEPWLQEHIKSLDYLVNYSSEGDMRDPFEYNLLQEYFNKGEHALTPILGICRGMQMLTVSQGIPLYVDIKKELGFSNRRWKLDKIYVTNPESIVQSEVKDNIFRGVKYHHQGLRLDYFNKHQERWPNLEVTSVSNRGKIAESLEFYDRPVLGVQYHPEWTFGKVRRGLFGWLLNRACLKKQNDKKQKLITGVN